MAAFAGGMIQSRSDLSPYMSGRGQVIKKVIDYKLDSGKKFYKVKWESSWETEETLLEYQNLVDQFWGFVNRVKSEDTHDPARKKVKLSDYGGVQSQNQSESQIRVPNHKIMGVVAMPSTNIVEKNSPSTISINPQSALNTASKITSIMSSGAAGSNTQEMKVQRTDTSITQKLPTGVNFTRDVNDLALHWDNPYVRIAFFCRICGEEQPFCHNENKWKQHFMTHVESQDGGEEPPVETNECSSSIILSKEDELVFKDPDRPWIQKVEHLIKKWGINQYVRLAFLCRVCGKEQQALHTGNWRNHHLSHRLNRPHRCDICWKTFKSKHDLKRHNKTVHEDKEPVYVRIHSCRICSKQFKKRFDMKRHIAQVHNIDPENINAQENENSSSGFIIMYSPNPSDIPGNTPDPKPIVEDHNESVSAALNKSPLPVPNAALQEKIMNLSAEVDSVTSVATHDISLQEEVQDQTRLFAEPSQHSLNHPFTSSEHETPEKLRTTQSIHITSPAFKPIVQEDSRISPVSIDKNYICGACFQTFRSKLELSKHQKKSTGCQEQGELNRGHVCKICFRSFKRKYDLNRHTANVHCMELEQAKLINSGIESSEVVNDGQFATMCSLKTSSGDRERNMTEQIQNEILPLDHTLQFTKDGTLPFDEIKMVIKEEPEEEEMSEIELVIDEDERPPISGKNEDESRRFQCDLCNLAFRRRDMLVRHNRTHSKDFCYFCSICGKGFIRRYVLVRHLTKEHGSTDPSNIHSTKRLRKDRKDKVYATVAIQADDNARTNMPDGLQEFTMVSNLSDRGASQDESTSDQEELNTSMEAVRKMEIDEHGTEQYRDDTDGNSDVLKEEDQTNHQEEDETDESLNETGQPQIMRICVKGEKDVEVLLLDEASAPVSNVIQLESLLQQAVAASTAEENAKTTSPLNSIPGPSILEQAAEGILEVANQNIQSNNVSSIEVVYQEENNVEGNYDTQSSYVEKADKSIQSGS